MQAIKPVASIEKAELGVPIGSGIVPSPWMILKPSSLVITIGTYLETLETGSRNYLDPRNPAAPDLGPLVSIWLAIDHNEGSTLC